MGEAFMPSRQFGRALVRGAVAAAGLIAAGCFTILPAGATSTVVAGFVTDGALEWPEYVAKELGWFKASGIDVQLLVVGGNAAPQLAAGSLNIAHSGFPDFMRASEHGAHLKIFLNSVAVPPYSVHAKPSITTIADLRGKVFSSGGAKSIGILYVKAFLAAGGLTLKDLDFIYSKRTQDRLSALLGGAVDAAILFPPASFRADAKGFTRLGEIASYLQDFPFTVWAVNTDWAAKNRDAVLGYVKNYGRAVRWLYDLNNESKAVEILLKYSKGTTADANATYDYFFRRLKAFSSSGLVTESGYKKMFDGLVDMGDMRGTAPPMDRYFDMSYVNQAWK